MGAQRRHKHKSAVVSGPVEIPDAEHELVIERVAAIDVAKAAGKVCVRLPGKTGRRFSRVWDVPARTGAVSELAEQLIESGIEKVTVESRSDYWRIWYYLLEAAGLSVQLVNARDVKNVPGRPTSDKLDAVWLAKLTEKGLLRPSFVPPTEIRRLRDYTRLRQDLTRDRARYWQRLEKLLEDALIKISSVASTLDTLSARDMIEALIAGERDPRRLAELARGRMKAKHSELITALDGRFDDHHGELARMLLGQIDALTTQIDTLSARIEALIAALPDHASVIDHPASNDKPGARAGAHSDADPDPTASTGRANTVRVDPPPGPTASWAPSSGSTRSPASAHTTRRPSWPRSEWTCPASPPPSTWCRGPSCARAPSSPGRSPAPARPARPTPTSKVRWARPPPRPPKPTPSSANSSRSGVRRCGERR